MKRIIDLSCELFNSAPVFDGDPETRFKHFNSIKSIGYNILQLSMSSHLGTHVDAPFHFLEHGQTVDEINLSKFIGRVNIVDMSNKKAGSFIDVCDLEMYSNKFIKSGKVILRTDWGENYPKAIYFKEFPQITVKAAEWISETGISLLGVETPSLNLEEFLKIHKIFLERDMVILEGLTNVKDIRKDSTYLIALPLKIKNGDGSPVRAIAINGYPK